MQICTAKASGINREAKSGCAREWGGWVRLSEDGPGQHNLDRSEGPWGRAAESARTEVFRSASSLTQCGESRWQQRARRAMANQFAGKAPSEIPALKPYRGKPAVRNFRGGNGNVGIIRSPVRAIALPDRQRARTDLCGGRSAMIVPTAPISVAILATPGASVRALDCRREEPWVAMRSLRNLPIALQRPRTAQA
jgi:hypothetical protein